MIAPRTAWFLALLLPLTADAEGARTIQRSRILVKDVVQAAPEGIADVDLGPAPPPGGSRLVSRTEVESHLRERGIETAKLVIPASVRIATAARRIAPGELGELAKPAIEQKLPRGVTLTKAEPTFEVVVPLSAVVRGAEIPRPPRQKGSFRSTATIELAADGEVVARVPVPIVLEISEDAARPDVARGSSVGLVIERRLLRISTQGSALADANVGDTLSAIVVATGRVVKARLTSPDEAQVLE
ncbi:MAG TPA: flagella basal body P-ring formation protein FlgA [Polyangiaceae bacterium]|nr:flagella basal body P-ring formation protein FlgA [Polyangiaceae bacterium]